MKRFLLHNAWVIYLSFWLSEFRLGISNWQFWAIIIPTIFLVALKVWLVEKEAGEVLK